MGPGRGPPVPGPDPLHQAEASAILPMLLFMLSLGSVYSLMFGNIGIIYRQGGPLMPYLFMIIMVGFEATRRQRIHSPEKGFSIGPLPRSEQISPALEVVK